jgi:hypothetical protein
MFWCGESGVYGTDDGVYRDTDWYRLPLSEGNVTLTVEAEFGALIGFVNADDCQAPYFYCYTFASCGVPTTLTCNIHDLWFTGAVALVAPDNWTPEYGCGCEYSLEITGHWCWNPVEAMSWGAVKALYRGATPR